MKFAEIQGNDEIRRRVGCTNIIVQLVYAKQHKWLGHSKDSKFRVLEVGNKARTTWMSVVKERIRVGLHRATELA